MNVIIVAHRVTVNFVINNAEKHMKKIEKTTTEKAQALLSIGIMTKIEMAAVLDISRPTLDTRLREGNWGKLEAREIQKEYDRSVKE